LRFNLSGRIQFAPVQVAKSQTWLGLHLTFFLDRKKGVKTFGIIRPFTAMGQIARYNLFAATHETTENAA